MTTFKRAQKYVQRFVFKQKINGGKEGLRQGFSKVALDKPNDRIYESSQINNWGTVLYGHLPRHTVVLEDSHHHYYTPCRGSVGVHILYGRSDGEYCYILYRGNVYSVPFFEVWVGQ